MLISFNIHVIGVTCLDILVKERKAIDMILIRLICELYRKAKIKAYVSHICVTDFRWLSRLYATIVANCDYEQLGNVCSIKGYDVHTLVQNLHPDVISVDWNIYENIH
jgi:hypothetical protein